MEDYTLTWTNWFLALALLVIIYLLLLLAASLLKTYLNNDFGRTIGKILDTILVLYEPLSIIILLVAFILINPYFHGLMAGILILLAFYPIRNYLSGRILRLTSTLDKGQRIKVNDSEGVIQELGRLRLNLQTSEGTKYVNFNTLLTEGFTTMKGVKVGGFHQIEVKNITETDISTNITYKLFNCPYLDWSFKPEISKLNEDNNHFDIRVLVKEDKHLNQFMDLMREWGYEVVLKA